MRIICLLLFFAVQSSASIAQNAKPSKINKDSLSLYMFLLDDCPICLNYTVLLNDLYSEYGSQISFQGYFPNFSSKQQKIDHFRETYKVEYPLKTDYYKEQAKKWNAQITPEVIFYNHTKQQIIYQGRIDNKFVRLGKRRNIVTEHDLIKAIKQTLKHEEVVTQYAEPVGCFINYSDQLNQKNRPIK